VRGQVDRLTEGLVARLRRPPKPVAPESAPRELSSVVFTSMRCFPADRDTSPSHVVQTIRRGSKLSCPGWTVSPWRAPIIELVCDTGLPSTLRVPLAPAPANRAVDAVCRQPPDRLSTSGRTRRKRRSPPVGEVQCGILPHLTVVLETSEASRRHHRTTTRWELACRSCRRPLRN